MVAIQPLFLRWEPWGPVFSREPKWICLPRACRLPCKRLHPVAVLMVVEEAVAVEEVVAEEVVAEVAADNR